MGGFSLVHILVVVLLIVLLFGTSKISTLMGDVAKGIKSFKKGLADDEDSSSSEKPQGRVIEGSAVENTTPGDGSTTSADKDKSSQ